MSANTINQYFGWKPDVPDHRDHYFSVFRAAASLPTFVDLRSTCPTPFNQFSLGSCTANAVAGSLKFAQIKQKKSTIFTASRLFIYYNTRTLEGTVNEDSGASLRNTIKSVAKWGGPPETDWAYNISQFKVKPPQIAYTNGLNNQAISYMRVTQSPSMIQTSLAEGFPFVFGFSVYQSFDTSATAATGVIPMPSLNEPNLGGHAVQAVGYNATTETVNGVPARHYICRNSWGPYWGASGYFFMPFDYLHNPDLAADFWTIRVVE